uniref:Uncharacterized protein n=1 Tax=Glossina palpalis gambiensis TaxID=67801 RepID=A0A1B0C2C6_9MUSC
LKRKRCRNVNAPLCLEFVDSSFTLHSTRSLQIFMSGLMVVKRFIVPNMRAKHKPVGQQNTISLKVTDDFHYFGNMCTKTKAQTKNGKKK